MFLPQSERIIEDFDKITKLIYEIFCTKASLFSKFSDFFSVWSNWVQL